MIYNNPFAGRIFYQSHNILRRWWTFVFGGTLFLLAVLIFAYPALIAYFFAGVILLTGVNALAVAWKLWRFSENISRIKQWPSDNNSRYQTRVPSIRCYS